MAEKYFKKNQISELPNKTQAEYKSSTGIVDCVTFGGLVAQIELQDPFVLWGVLHCIPYLPHLVDKKLLPLTSWNCSCICGVFSSSGTPSPLR